MSKRSKKKRVHEAAPPRMRRFRLAVALLCGCMLLMASFAATRLNPVRHAIGLAPLLAAATQQGGQGSLPLAKEYIYAGGRLVATEEPQPTTTPTPGPAGPAPSGLVATGSLPSIDTSEVRLTWVAPSPAPLSYVVERASVRLSDALQTDYAQLGPPVTTSPTQSAPFLDPSPTQGMVYAYRVKAVYASGTSDYSNRDVATTFRYTGDDPLIGANDPQHRPQSLVLAANLSELRAVIDAVRKLAGLGPATWKGNPAPLPLGQILAAHFAELRTQLNPALDALGITPVAGSDAAGIAGGQRVTAAHVQNVRDKVR